MSRTITALYDSRSEAESARERLSSAAEVSNVDIHEQSSGETGSSESGEHRSWFEKLFLPDEDRETYGEGLRRGNFLLTAQVDDEENADRIVSLLEETSAIDVDERSESWRSEGWQPQSRQSTGLSGASSDAFGSAGAPSGQFGSSDYQESGNLSSAGERTVAEERIPIVQEELQIGKREVERGGARIRSYVRETPVTEQVHLREENVEIERRPVNETLSSSDLNRDSLLEDREIEMRATGEEAVVAKEAHVNEEVVVRKTESEHTENVQDTVRHTEVDVDEDASSRGAFGFDRDRDSSETLRESSDNSELENDNFGRR